jgi:flagellar hook-length control protein FliK
MSAIPAIVEREPRAVPARAASEASTASTETKFQDAVDARRASRAQSAAKSGETHRANAEDGTREEDSKSSETKISEAKRSDASESGANRSDAKDSEATNESPADAANRSTPLAATSRASVRGSSDPSSALGDEHAPHRALRTDEDAGEPDSAAARDTDASTPVVPWSGPSALQEALTRALPQGPASDATANSTIANASSATLAAARSADTAASSADPIDPGVAALQLSTAFALGDDAAPAPQKDARATATADRAGDARSTPATIDVLAKGAPAAAETRTVVRATPAELPSVLDHLAVHVQGTERKAVVQLDPPELGRLSISLSVESGGHVRAEMRAESPNGYAALESRASQLHASLLARGFTSASVNLSLGLADPRSQDSGTRAEPRKRSTAARRTLADSEVRAMLPASAGAIDMWA